MSSLFACFLFTSLACNAFAAENATFEFDSPALGRVIHGQYLTDTKPDATTRPSTVRTVVYFKNLSATRLGTASDDDIIRDLERNGMQVASIDFEHDPKATGENLVIDVLKLRDAITSKKPTMFVGRDVDAVHLFFIPEGCSLKREVAFAKDGARTLAMDIVYPVNPKSPVPVLMEFTCDNKDRMGSVSLLFCHDAILEGASMSGFATAMVDHPVAPPYKGIDDPMPQVLYRAKAAVRTLRNQSNSLKLSDRIGVIGFSRGGPIAAMLATTDGRADLEGDTENTKGTSSDIQCALIHGNRYDYLDLLPKDPMLARFEKVWGKRDENKDKWAAHGAALYLTKDAAPMFLNTSDAESPEYRDGLEKFSKRLEALGIDHTYQVDVDGRGHRVSTDPKTLDSIYAFFRKHLRDN